MLDFIWHSVAAQLGLAGLAIAACLAVAWFVPPFRRTAIGVAGLIFSAAAIYAKGSSDAKRADKARSDAAVAANQKKFNEIDARHDDADSVADRLRDGKF